MFEGCDLCQGSGQEGRRHNDYMTVHVLLAIVVAAGFTHNILVLACFISVGLFLPWIRGVNTSVSTVKSVVMFACNPVLSTSHQENFPF